MCTTSFGEVSDFSKRLIIFPKCVLCKAKISCSDVIDRLDFIHL